MEEKIKQFVETLLPETFGLNNYISIRVKKLEAGCYNVNFLLYINSEKFVLRRAVHSDGVEGNNLEKEYKTLNMLNGLYAPKVIYYSSSFPALIEEFIPGEKPQKLDDELIRKIARALATVHLTSTRNQPVPLKDYQEHIEKRSNNLRPQTKKVLKPYLEKAKDYIREKENRFNLISKQVLNHGDMHCSNIFKHENDIKFIDWENSSLTDPAFDIAAFFYEAENGQFFSEQNSITREQKDLFLSEYLRYHQDIYLKEKLQILTPLRWLSDTLWIDGRIASFNETPPELREKSIEQYGHSLQYNINVLKQMWQ